MNTKRGCKCLMGGMRLALTVSLLLATSVPALAVPTITGRSPAPNATWVSEYAPVTAFFSEEMSPATITDNSFILEKKVGVVAVAMGSHDNGYVHTVALQGDGTVVEWIFDQLRSSSEFSDVVAVAAGAEHTLVLDGDGLVKSWRWTIDGQKRDLAVPANLSEVIAIAAGAGHSVALRGNGTVAVWGTNADGQATVPAGLRGVVAIAAGGAHTVALKGDGTVVAWGRNENGQTTVPPGLSGVVAIAAGHAHTVALKGDGSVVAWGANDLGQTTVPAELIGVVAIAAGGAHTVALKGDGTVAVWGWNEFATAGISGVVAIAAGGGHTVALKGDGSLMGWTTWGTPVEFPSKGLHGIVAVAAGERHSLALRSDGTVFAWGDTGYGATYVPAGLRNVMAIAAGVNHSVALKRDGTVVTWGGESFWWEVPAELSGVIAIAAGDRFNMALKSNGTVVMWGDNIPFDYGGNLSGVVAISANKDYAVAVKNNGTVVVLGGWLFGHEHSGFGDVVSAGFCDCAGYGSLVVLRRDGTVVEYGEYQRLPDSNVIAISVSGMGGFLLKGDGAVVELGGSTVPVGLNNVSIAVGGGHMLALKGDGTVVAWGLNDYGQATVPTAPALGYAPVPATLDQYASALTPAEPLALQAVYRASVFGRSLVGTPLAGSGSWQFSTGESNASFLVMPKAGSHGKITPAIGRLTVAGSVASFLLTPDLGYVVDNVTGCEGTLVGTTYKTGPISQACTVTATFRPLPTAVAAPTSLTIPVADADGAYTVSWEASVTAGVTYELQEATNSLFTTGLRTAYSGTAQSALIAGRSQYTTYFYRVWAKKVGYTSSGYVGNNGCAVPGTAAAGIPASLTVPPADADGAFSLNWDASATVGVTYVLQEATTPTFPTDVSTVYSGPLRTATLLRRPWVNTYYYRVKAIKAGLRDSAWRIALKGCAVPGTLTMGLPGTMTVPTGDTDGTFTVSWEASTTLGVYHLQEATNSTFTQGLRTAYFGTDTWADITGRETGKTYYYRVQAVTRGARDSGYRTAANGCAVPGTYMAGAPASLTVPASDPDGSYTVNWTASATAGIIYELQEATNNTFTTGLRLTYRGTALTANLTGRTVGMIYYYRVRAVKSGLKDSVYRKPTNGCRIGL